jgi:MYXO-CTERM domain-containing protein
MTRFRWALLAALLAPAPATAGPVAWSYTSTGAGQGGDGYDPGPYGFDPTSGAFETEAGEAREIDLVTGVRAPWLISPIPLTGPTLWTRVELVDGATGEAFSFRIPVGFYDNEPAPPNVWDMHVPRIGDVPPFDILLGRHVFHVTRGSDLTLTVGVTNAPEPATLVMGAVGLAGLGLVRRRAAAGQK